MMVAVSLSDINKLWPPGIFFMIYLSIFSFSNIARLPSTKMGGGVESYLDRKSGGGFSMSTVVTCIQKKMERKRR
jgi:hypothetical protein